MSRLDPRVIALSLAALIALAACSGGSTPTAAPTAAPSAPTPAPTMPTPSAPAPTEAPSAAPTDGTGDQARVGGWTSLDPCSLVSSEAMSAAIGTLAGEPVRAGGDQGGTVCTWTTASGGTLSMATADPERFAAMRAAAAGAEDVSDLGSGAYVSAAGATSTLVVHGGSVVVTLETDLGRDAAVAAARVLLEVLAVV